MRTASPTRAPTPITAGLTALATGVVLALTACGGGNDPVSSALPAALGAPTLSFVSPRESLDLANYTLSRRVTLPVDETAGANQIAKEVSAVTYNEVTDSLFIIGDEGTYITQISKAGAVVDTMNLPAGLFGDPEGLTWAGGNTFVVANERERSASLVTYAAGTTLAAANVRTVKLGSTVGNIGLEGVTRDPMTGGYIFVKETAEQAIFQTAIDFNAGTATNGSPTTGSGTTPSSVNLFDPSLMRMADIADVHALSNSVAASAPDYSHLLVMGQEDGRILKVDRAGRIFSRLDLPNSPNLGHEGLTFDRQLNLYVTNEAGGGSQSLPQLWVYTPTRTSAQVGLASNLYLNFAGTVAAGTGNITLVGANGDTRSIAVTDTRQVTIDGGTVRIDPAADLSANTSYSIQFAAGVFKDATGLATQAVNSAQTLGFTSVPDTTAPTLQTSAPAANASGVLPGANLQLNFSERVQAGSGTFTITDGAADVRIISAADAAQVSYSGSSVTIDPAADLAPGTVYSVQVSATALRDAAGNPYAGIADALTLNFTTAGTAVTPPVQLLISEINSNAAGGDFFEIYNYGTTAANLSGYRWDDDSADFAIGTALPAYLLPAGGRLVVAAVPTAQLASFTSAWGLAPTVPVAATDGPGLGAGGDMVVLFDRDGKVVASLSYASAAKTATDGTVISAAAASAGITPVYNQHAGQVFGGNGLSSAVWDGLSSSAPTYRAAAVGVAGGFAQPAVATTVGSPGR